MDELIEQFVSAWSEEDKEARDESRAREIAATAITEFSSEFKDYDKKELPDLVAAVDLFRAAGWEKEYRKIEMYILHSFAPQNIGGEYYAVRTNNG